MNIFQRIPELKIEFDDSRIIKHQSILTKNPKSHLEIIQDRIENELLDSIEIFNNLKVSNLLYRINYNKEVSYSQFYKIIENAIKNLKSSITELDIENKTYTVDKNTVFFLLIKRK